MSRGSRRLHSRPRLYFALGLLENGNFVQGSGSIDSLAPARSPLRGFVYVARLPA
jgi:hypothetical protein